MRSLVTILIISIQLLTAIVVRAQDENTDIRTGNKFYKQGQLDKALPEYQKAIRQNPKNPIPHFNAGNVQFRSNNFSEAEKSFGDAAEVAGADSFKASAYYNKGVALARQKKLEESVEAWKNVLRLNPNDEDARFNLEKGLSELKKIKDQKEQKQQPKQQQKQQEKQKPPPSKLDKKKIEQYLQSLQQREQEVQRKIQQNRTRSVTQPDKDW